MHRQEVEKQRERERSAAAEDPKKIAQKQAIEKRRMELQKKDQQRPAANHVNALDAFFIITYADVYCSKAYYNDPP